MYNEVLEELVVVKRSGQRVPFNASKVAIAIKKAFDSINSTDDKKIFKTFEKTLNYINENYRDRKTINVEDIQDIIENILYNEKHFAVYNSFKDYRQKRALSRKVFAEKQQHKFLKAIEKIEESNNNKDNLKSADDLIFDFGRIISSEYTKAYVLDTKSVRGAEEGNIYIHDLDYFSLGMFSKMHLMLDDRLKDEYHIDNLINKIIDSEREVYEEIGINNIDCLLEPYILEKFKVIFGETIEKYLKVQGYIELVNIKKIVEQICCEKSININFAAYDNFLVNVRLKETFNMAYEDSYNKIVSLCERVIYKILLSLENRSERKTTFTISFGLNEGDIGKILNSKLISILSRERFNKIHINFKIKNLNIELITKIIKIIEINKDINIQFVNDSNINKEYFNDGVIIFENANDNKCCSSGRMVVSSTSINLARLGLKYVNKDIKLFYNDLENVVELVRNELLLSFETIGSKCKEYYRTLFRGNAYDDEKLECGQKIRKVIKNGFLNIGVIGLKECVCCLEKDPTKAKQLIKDIIEFLNKCCKKFTEETKVNFGLYEPVDTKARRRLLAIDKAVYGIVPEVTDKDKYDLIDIENVDDYKSVADIQKRFSSGKRILINTGKLSIKKTADLLESLKNSEVEFVKLVVDKNEY